MPKSITFHSSTFSISLCFPSYFFASVLISVFAQPKTSHRNLFSCSFKTFGSFDVLFNIPTWVFILCVNESVCVCVQHMASLSRDQSIETLERPHTHTSCIVAVLTQVHTQFTLFYQLKPVPPLPFQVKVSFIHCFLAQKI